ncbi:carbohydrate binding domain-containing protein [bacterium]|nr:carbohydrate binding domain-containing protein [bacterium]
MSCKLVFCILLLLSVLTLAYGGDTNILVNPGFESGTECWFDRTCAIEVATKPVYSGRGSGKALQRLANWQGIKQSVFGKMIAGVPYKVSGWVRLDNAKNDVIKISFEQQDDSGTQYIGVAQAAVNDSEWVQLSGEFTLEVEGTLSVLDVYFEGPEPGVNFYVDDVVVFGPEVDAPEVIPPEPKGKGKIDATIHHQKIEGFGASGAYYISNLANHHEKSELCDLLFKGLGLDIFRISNHYEMNSDDFNATIDIARRGEAALGRDLKILMSSWSPPSYLKSNENTIGGTLKQKDGKFMYTEFAEWWAKSLAAYANAGLKVDYISIQNELDYEAPWNSCQFSPTEDSESNLAAYDIAFETVWQKLHDEMGPDMPKMLVPESSGLGNSRAYIENINDLSHFYGFAHHLYDCSGCGIAPDRFIPRMISYRELAAEFGGKPIFQTEFEENPGLWADAINTALVIHNSLTVEKISAYLYWDLFWEPGTGLISMNDVYTYTIKPTYYTFKQYSGFIHSGWQRVEASAENTGLRISAYIGPNYKKMTVVILNTTEDIDISLELLIKGFSLSEGELYRSSHTENCVRVGSYNGKVPLRLPASSVTTLLLSAGKP